MVLTEPMGIAEIIFTFALKTGETNFFVTSPASTRICLFGSFDNLLFFNNFLLNVISWRLIPAYRCQLRSPCLIFLLLLSLSVTFWAQVVISCRSPELLTIEAKGGWSWLISIGHDEFPEVAIYLSLCFCWFGKIRAKCKQTSREFWWSKLEEVCKASRLNDSVFEYDFTQVSECFEELPSCFFFFFFFSAF